MKCNLTILDDQHTALPVPPPSILIGQVAKTLPENPENWSDSPLEVGIAPVDLSHLTIKNGDVSIKNGGFWR